MYCSQSSSNCSGQSLYGDSPQLTSLSHDSDDHKDGGTLAFRIVILSSVHTEISVMIHSFDLFFLHFVKTFSTKHLFHDGIKWSMISCCLCMSEDICMLHCRESLEYGYGLVHWNLRRVELCLFDSLVGWWTPGTKRLIYVVTQLIIKSHLSIALIEKYFLKNIMQ